MSYEFDLHLRSKFKTISNCLQSQPGEHGQTCKIVHGDLFVRPTVKGVKKGQRSSKFENTANGKNNNVDMFGHL